LIRYQTTNGQRAKKGTSLLEFELFGKAPENSWHEFKDLEDALTSWRYLMSDCKSSGSAYSEP
jgi:hypothetical protein